MARLRVLGCCTAGGRVEAPPSLWDALLKISAVALAGSGVVRGLRGRSKCIGYLLDALRALGLRIFRAGDRVEIHGHTGEGRRTIFFNVDCGLHTAALAVAVAARYLAPPQQLVLRASSEAMLRADTRPLMELALALGLKAWPGGSLSRLVIVEPSSAGIIARPVRLSTRHAYTLAAALLAASTGGVSVRSVYPLETLRGRSRLESAMALLRGLGVEVRMRDEHTVSVGVLDGRPSLEAAGGYAETTTLLSMLLPCQEAELEIRGLPGEQWGLESDATYLLEAMGYTVERSCSGGGCTLAASKKAAGAVRGVAYSVEAAPDLLPALSAYAAVSGDASISGLGAADAELPASQALEATLRHLGLEAYLEDGGERLAVSPPPETVHEEAGGQQHRLQCPKGTPAPCTAIVAWVLSRCSGLVDAVDTLEDHTPTLLELLVQLTGTVDVS